MRIDPHSLELLQALVLGFAFAGLLASAFELVTERRASFGLLQAGGVLALMSVPVLVFSAPVIILRNTIRGRSIEGRPVGFVMLATMLACGWSLVSGRVVLDLTARLVGV